VTPLVKVMAAAITGCALGLIIKRNSPHLSLLVSVAVSVFALYISLDVISAILGFLDELAADARIPPEALTAVMKTVGVSIVTRVVSDVCKDAGQTSAASGVELLGAVTSVYIALPIFRTVVSMINNLL
jgi:stage III sporulation protein AD